MNSKTKKKRTAYLWEALIPIVFTIGMLMYSILVTEGSVHIPLVLGALVASIVAIYRLGLTWKELEEGIVSSISGTMSAILILAIIGMIIGTWILGGIVPTLIYYGLNILSPKIFLVATCGICAIIALATGSSWTTAGTVGIALIGVGTGLGIPLPMTAGAIISGAYFGDKMSPLSDTTNLSPAIAGANLFDHVKHMSYTTGASLIISLVGFGVLGFTVDTSAANTQSINTLLNLLSQNFSITPLLFIVPAIVIILVAKKVPAIPGLFIGTLLGGLAAMIFQEKAVGDVLAAMMDGVKYETGNATIDTLLTRGGLQSMMWTISLIICALTFGGVLEKSGMLETVANKILFFAKSTGSLIFATIFSCIFVNVLAGDQYLSIVLPGKMFKDEYRKRGLAPRNLSRALEDAGTLTSPLVPWNTCGATMSTYLGVATIEYIPYCFLNLINPIVSIVYGYLGITIMKLEDDPSAPEYKGN